MRSRCIACRRGAATALSLQLMPKMRLDPHALARQMQWELEVRGEGAQAVTKGVRPVAPVAVAAKVVKQ